MSRSIAAVLTACALTLFGAEVHMAEYNTLDLDTHPMIVTNVTFEGLTTSNDVQNMINASGGGSGGSLTTNDVCAIVTNVVPWWTFSPPSLMIEGEPRTILVEPSGDYFTVYAGTQEYPLSPVLYPGSSLVFAADSDYGEVEITATWSPRNALGLARLRDLVAATNDLQQTVTNIMTLTPVYGGNGERLEWTYSPQPTNYTVVEPPVFNDGGGWTFTYRYGGEDYWCLSLESGSDATTISFTPENTEAPSEIGPVTATLVPNPVIGYVLGAQTNSVLAATNGLVSEASFADATNRIAALEALLSGLESALHAINTGTNLVTNGGN